ncbi:uncharacterized protein LOC104896806 isoform X1 [Beta vulgaris subsp. vulgaris]|uniref:uncharacterized protein LOC104896806 isoform X1 n=1 Tax=Beta vulgaris subsp. vulgaris TaxID=3555 RepID=UPI0025470602|nr:uncharacterized protein LOC104896806 isoform X1 [Beta vulgaris subsp. vulgaris]
MKIMQQERVPMQSNQNQRSSGLENPQLNISNSIVQSRPLSHGPKQNEGDVGIHTKTVQKKSTFAPGSLGADMRLKARIREKELRDKKANAIREIQIQNTLEGQYENYRSSDEIDSEQGEEEDVDWGDFVHAHNDEIQEHINEALLNQEQEREEGAPTKGKRTRGPTMCKDVHAWTAEDRKPIILNEMGKPIGPDKKTVDKFSRFLGTLARNSSLAPLNKLNWHHVVDKDKIWSYVKKKYMISEEGKDPVLASIGRLWRKHKCIIKQRHFTQYDNDNDRKKNAPDTMPASHFKDLLEFWNLELVQIQSEKKRESRLIQTDRHTMGPTSFARKQHELQQQDAEKKPPSQALLYKETRKRKADKNYKTSFEPIQRNIEKMEEVQKESQINGDDAYYKVMNKSEKLKKCAIKGKCKGDYVGGVVIPDEFLQSYKDQIVKDTVREVMKTFEQQLEPGMFANLSHSLENVSTIHNITKHLHEGTTDQEKDKDEENQNDELE